MEEEVTQPEQTAETQEPEVNVEDLKSKLDAAENEKKQLQQTVSKHARREQELQVTKNALDSLAQRLDGTDERFAQVMDYLEEIRGEPSEQKRKSHVEELKEKRQQEQQQPKQEDPAVHKFFNYLEAHDLTTEDDMVKEVLRSDPSPDEALKQVKQKVKESSEQSTDSKVEEKVDQRVQQKLKEMGVAGGDSTPSASDQSFERVRDAFNADPTDPQKRAAYFKARKERGI